MDQKPDLQAKKQIVIGTGGGFSGAIKEYILLENGYLYQRELPKDTTFQIRVLYRSTAKKYFTKLTQLGLKRRKFDNPGNVYYYVEKLPLSKVYQYLSPTHLKDFVSLSPVQQLVDNRFSI